MAVIAPPRAFHWLNTKHSVKIYHCQHLDQWVATSLVIILISLLSLSVLTAIFQVNLGEPVFIEAKDDGGGEW